MSNFYTYDLRKARKAHTCDVCREPIPVGAHHVRAAGAFDGSMWDSRTHPGCEWLRAAANRMLNEYSNDGWEDPRALMVEADVDELPKVLTWSGIGSFNWPHCFDLAALPEEEQVRVRRLVDAAVRDAEANQ